MSLLELGMGVPFADIFVTSAEGQGISPGEDGNARIYEELQSAPVAISLFTSDYLASLYCMCELGAIWGRSIPFAPLLAPPLTHEHLPGPTRGRQALRLDNGADLDSLREFILHSKGYEGVPVSRWNVQKDMFIKDLPAFYRSADREINQNKEFLLNLGTMPQFLAYWLDFFSDKIGSKYQLWMLILDVDAQKNINQRFGVRVGDEILSAISYFFYELDQPPYRVLSQGRCGDDTFYAMFVGDDEFAKELASHLLEKVKKIPAEREYELSRLHAMFAPNHEIISRLWVTASIGLARYPIEVERNWSRPKGIGQLWIHCAHNACVAARASGGGRMVFGNDMKVYELWS